jgi:hypothetical protein
MMYAAFNARYRTSRPCHFNPGRTAFTRCWNPTVMGGILRCAEHGGLEVLEAMRKRMVAQGK